MRKLSKRQFVKLSEDTRDRWKHMNRQIEPLEKGTRSISFAQFMKEKCQKLTDDPESLFHNDEFINLLGERRQTDWAKDVVTRSRATLHIPPFDTQDVEVLLMSAITTDRLMCHYTSEKTDFNISIKTGRYVTERFDSTMTKVSNIGMFTVPRKLMPEINGEDK